MTALKRLRQIVGARGDWNDRGRCQLRSAGLILEVRAGRSDVYLDLGAEPITEFTARQTLETLERADREKHAVSPDEAARGLVGAP